MTNRINNFLFESSSLFLNRSITAKLIATFCIINVLLISPDLFNLFGSSGLVEKNINDSFLAIYQPKISWFINPLMGLNIGENLATFIFFMVYLLSLVSITLNFKPLISSIIAWIFHLAIINSSYLFSYGADYFISFMIFINVIIISSSYLRNGKGDVLYSFVMRFLQIHLCIIYFFAGLGKVLGEDWLDGNAIWLVINTYAPSAVGISLKFIDYPIIFKLLSLGIFLELVYPIFVYIPKLRKILLLFIVAMHLAIAFIMEFYTFGAIMILMNVIAFGHVFGLNKIIFERGEAIGTMFSGNLDNLKESNQ